MAIMGKAIFIGLGGAGVTPTGHLKAKMLFDHYGGNHQKMAEDCRFIFIDTDDDAINRLNKDYELRMPDGRKFISNEERVNLGDVNPYATYWMAMNPTESLTDNQKRLLTWVDPEGAKRFKNQQLREGASANRQQGRIAVWAMWDEIANKIRTALNILNSLKDQADFDKAYPTFHVLSGTCGGTGSSAFLDVLYLLDRQYRDKFQDKAGDPRLRAVLFLPYLYIEASRSKRAAEVTIEDYQCNAFGFFDELEAALGDKWISGDGTKVSAITTREVNLSTNKPFPVFNFSFCIDSKTERGYSMDDVQMYKNTAELLYYWHLGSSAQSRVISQIDNEQQAIGAVRPGDAVPLFLTIGYRALRFPEELMEQYFKQRFAYELLEYGIYGDKYDSALPDEHRRNEHIEQAFKKCIARYLFTSDREAGITNLEIARREKLEEKLQFFDIGRFKREGKDVIDLDKVADADLLADLELDAQSIARDLYHEMVRDFEESGLTSKENIIRLIRHGHQEATGKFGSLEDEIEDAILRFGLRYAVDLTRRLDVISEERVQRPGADNDLMDKIETLQRRAKDLEGETASARVKCQSARRGNRESALQEFFGNLGEQIKNKVEITILEQQVAVLNVLSMGDQGILDEYRRNLTNLATEVRQRLDNKEHGLAELFQTVLPKDFLATSDDVTTTYLPPVATFVEQGKWGRGSLFAIHYQKIVEQTEVPGGGEKPRRYGSDYGYAASKRGLHGVLWDILTQRAYTGLEHGYASEGHTNFFRKGFAKNPPEWLPSQLIAELLRCAEKYIVAQTEANEEIRNERKRSLAERFNALENEEKQKIRNQFDDTGTQTFCMMDGDEGTVYSVYAGSKNQHALAVELGYNPNDQTRYQFVEDETRNRLVRIKVLTRQTLRRYPHYRDLQHTYGRVKERRTTERMLFAPHIHKIFNKIGAKNGLIQAALNTEEQRMRYFVLMLIYREMFAQALKSDVSLLEQVLDINPAFKGQQKRHSSPFVVELQANGTRIARICVKLERTEDDRVKLLEQNFVTFCPDAQNFRRIFSDLRNYGVAGIAPLAEFDEYFKDRASFGWVQMLRDAHESLSKKVEQGIKSDRESVKVFYEELNNYLVNANEELSQKLADKASRATTRKDDISKSVTSQEGNLVLDI